MDTTVVIPTYERPDSLVETVDSVCRQTATDYDVIVVDDGSTLDAQSKALEYIKEKYNCVKVLQQENQGPAAARNKGWRQSTANIILFTDDDCIVPESWVENLINGFEDGIGGVGGQLVPPASALRKSQFAKLHQYKNETIYGRPDTVELGGTDLPMGGTANIAYRRDVLEEVNGFDESFPTAAGEDADLLKRVSDAGYQMKYIPVHVKHNADYNWNSFKSRTIRHGMGTYYYDKRHNTPRPVWRVLLGLLTAPTYFIIEMLRSQNPIISALIVLERIFSRYGELYAKLKKID